MGSEVPAKGAIGLTIVTNPSQLCFTNISFFDMRLDDVSYIRGVAK
jgi:hypothetical protein